MLNPIVNVVLDERRLCWIALLFFLYTSHKLSKKIVEILRLARPFFLLVCDREQQLSGE